jgi:hypothetical protein
VEISVGGFVENPRKIHYKSKEMKAYRTNEEE